MNNTFAYTDTVRNRLGKPLSTVQSNRQPFVQIKDVCKVYPTKNGPFTVLDGVNLNVYEGEFICVIGHSGCGKSTMLNMVSGFAHPTSGRVEGGYYASPLSVRSGRAPFGASSSRRS